MYIPNYKAIDHIVKSRFTYGAMYFLTSQGLILNSVGNASFKDNDNSVTDHGKKRFVNYLKSLLDSIEKSDMLSKDDNDTIRNCCKKILNEYGKEGDPVFLDPQILLGRDSSGFVIYYLQPSRRAIKF